jgi:glutamine amidotransferase
MGNLFSVARACEKAGMHPQIVTNARDAASAEGLILPGVGAFADAMLALERQGLISVIKDFAAAGRPLMGICLGMQLLMQESFEFGQHQGLGIFAGQVVRFEFSATNTGDSADANQRMPKVPQVGWNTIEPYPERSWQGTLLEGLDQASFLYFVHSYYVVPSDRRLALAYTLYGSIEFCSCLEQGNIFACQAHPEKSAQAGIRIYQNFAQRLLQRRSSR